MDGPFGKKSESLGMAKLVLGLLLHATLNKRCSATERPFSRFTILVHVHFHEEKGP